MNVDDESLLTILSCGRLYDITDIIIPENNAIIENHDEGKPIK